MQTPSSHGSSRNSGAIIRGKAQGNTPNIADIEDDSPTSNIVACPITYRYVYLYRSEDRSLLSLEEMEDTSKSKALLKISQWFWIYWRKNTHIPNVCFNISVIYYLTYIIS